MGRSLKKPQYDKEQITTEYLAEIAKAFAEPYDDRFFVGVHSPSLRQVAEQFHVAPICMRKLLITAGVYSTRVSRQIADFLDKGMSIEEIQKETGLSRASIHSYIPYTKAVYKMPERSTNADRTALYRKRMRLVREIGVEIERVSGSDANWNRDLLWEVVCAFEGYFFAGDVTGRFRYQVKGDEVIIAVDGGEVVIGRSSAEQALENVMKEGTLIDTFGTGGEEYLRVVLGRFGSRI